jgi:hypothetical protein
LPAAGVLFAVPIARVFGAVGACVHLRAEMQQDRAGFVGAHPPDAHLPVALEHLRLRMMVAVAVACLENAQRGMHREQEAGRGRRAAAVVRRQQHVGAQLVGRAKHQLRKGREGWNCRSLFGVGLFREPKSRVFVLQATMRCLRSIGQAQHTGHVFLSNANLDILNDELQQNFHISVDDLQKVASDKVRVEVRVVAPPVKIKLVRVRKQYEMREKKVSPGQPLGLDRSDKDAWNTMVEKYRLIEIQQDGLNLADAARAPTSRTFDLTARREKQTFSRMTLVAEVSRYLNRSPLEIEDLLDSTKDFTPKEAKLEVEAGEVYVGMAELLGARLNLGARRLLVLNVCDGASYPGGFKFQAQHWVN